LWYLTDLWNKYYTPIFKLNIFLNQKFLLNNDLRKKAVKFLNNIFECFDWLDEKEFLIDLNNELYYEKWGFFSKKVFPHYDFSDIWKIEKLYDEGKWVKILEDFIKIFQNKTLVIDQEKASYYHKIHSCFLYFIYLVFLISQNLEKINSLDFNICENSEYKAHLDLTEKRVSYIKEVEKQVFDKYVRILEIFFWLF
jgi:hypothetical protein